MRYGEFLEKVISKGIELTSWPEGYSWLYYGALRLTTEDINYGCDFDNKGQCTPRKNYKDKNAAMCCCSGCFKSVAHLRILPKNYIVLEQLAKLFVKPRKDWRERKTEAQGFWRRGVGCVLPRQYRSTICVRYSCNSKNMDEKSRFLLEVIGQERRWHKINETERRFERFIRKHKLTIDRYTKDFCHVDRIPEAKEAVWAFINYEMRCEQRLINKDRKLRHGSGGNIALEPGITAAAENHEFERLRLAIDLFSGDGYYTDINRLRFIAIKTLNKWRRDYVTLSKTG